MDTDFLPSPLDPEPAAFTPEQAAAQEAWIAGLALDAPVEIYTEIPFLGSSWEPGIVWEHRPDAVLVLGHATHPHSFARNSPRVRPRR